MIQIDSNPFGRNTRAAVVTLSNGTELLFSYSTCIAARHGTRRARLANSWGPTTGRHFNEFGAKDWPILGDTEFAAFCEALEREGE